MNWLMRIIAWRSKQPAIIRWLAVFGLYGVAVAARFALGLLYGGVPSLIFFPVLLIVTVLFGWKEGLVVLGLSVIAGLYLFLPTGMDLLPVGWVVVGGFSIGVIGALKSLAQELADANERQRVLFQEMQHRVANSLQSVVSILDQVRRKTGPASLEARDMLEEGIRRIMASADVHRRLNDPTLFVQGLGPVLRHAVMTVIDGDTTNVNVDIEPVRLSFDEMSIITMLVIEIANNAQKHVFDRQFGESFEVALQELPDGRAVLSVKDDGPGWSQEGAGNLEGTLGRVIIRRLADQLGGQLSIESEYGTEIKVVFPLRGQSQSSTSHKHQSQVRRVTEEVASRFAAFREKRLG
jgi:two-component sensor histidine kinase